MSTDHKTLGQACRDIGLMPEQVDELVGMLLNTSCATFEEHTGLGQVVFIDCAIRMMTALLFKLDDDAARDYAAVIAEMPDNHSGVAFSRLVIRHTDALQRLQDAFYAFADRVGETQGRRQ